MSHSTNMQGGSFSYMDWGREGGLIWDEVEEVRYLEWGRGGGHILYKVGLSRMRWGSWAYLG